LGTSNDLARSRVVTRTDWLITVIFEGADPMEPSLVKIGAMPIFIVVLGGGRAWVSLPGQRGYPLTCR